MHKYKAGDKIRLVNIPINLAGHIYNGFELKLEYKHPARILAWYVTPDLINPDTQKPFTCIEEEFMELINE